MLNKEKLISLIVSIISFIFGFLLISNSNLQFENKINDLSNRLVETHALVLERSIIRSTSSATILGAHAHALNGNIYDFEEYSQTLINSLGGITNLQLAPNGIISDIYPSKGHEKALGHDIFNADNRKKEAFLAKDTRKLTLAGPFELIQGGTAVIARFPVYLHDKDDLKENETHKHSTAKNFWGFTTALLMLNDLLSTTDLELLKEKEYLYRIWRYHPDTKKVDVFAGTNKLPGKKIFTKKINVPNSTWYLDIEYIGLTYSELIMYIFFVLNILIPILIGYLLYIILIRPKELKREVDLKTNELQVKNEELIHDKLELKKLTNAVTYNSNGIFIANNYGLIEYINPAFELITGFSINNIKNENIDLFQKEIYSVVKNKKYFSGKCEYKKRDNETFVSLLSISLIKDEKGFITNYVGVCEDITKQIKDENELKENEFLLLQQSKMASIGEMFENIAHQWRQPLSAISTSSSSLKLLKEMGTLEDDVFMENVNAIFNNTIHLSNTIDDFRNYFKADKTIKEFSVKEVLLNTLSLMQFQITLSNIEVVLNVKDIKITNISNELIQVLMNIITNAKDELIKIKSRKLIFIDIDKLGENILIEVKDNAGGIRTNVITEIFDPRFTTKEKDGTGIGLYMSKKIIEDNMLGHIDVENSSYEYNNEKYIGAKFTITLPIKR